MREIIHRNSAFCFKCHVEIVSESVHDMKTCTCGNISVDGGKEYLRRLGPKYGFDSVQDTSIVEVIDDLMEDFDG